MGIANNRQKAHGAGVKIQDKVKQTMSVVEVSSSIRESRQGFRGFGAFQMKKLYSAQGVHVIDIGGPPVAGR